jgi:Sugar-tranasporters, 12 TM
MDMVYWILFAGLAASAAGLELTKAADTTIVKNSDFKRFRNNYLLVYSLMMGEPMVCICCQRHSVQGTMCACCTCEISLTERSPHHVRSGRLAPGAIRVCAVPALRLWPG